MKRFLAVGFLVVLAAVTALTWTGVAEAGRMKTIQVKWATNADSTGGDRTFLTDENDTTRTVPIDLSDWDFAQPGTTTEIYLASVAFVAGTSDGVADSIYYCIEKSWDGVNWTLGTLVTTVGNNAVVQGTQDGSRSIFAGGIVYEPDEIGSVNLGALLPKMFRLKVAGDQGGSNPALADLKCYITYPTLFDY